MCGSKVLFLIKKPAGIEELFQRKPAFLIPLPEFRFGSWVFACLAVGSLIRHCCMENNGVRSDTAFIYISAVPKPFRKPGRQSAPGHGWGSIPTAAPPFAQAVPG